MSALVDPILSTPTWALLGLVGLVVFVEDALFFGFVVPGETAAVLGGVAASLGHAPLAAVVAVVVAAAVVGDSVGYEVGRLVGPRLLRLRILDKRRARLDDAQRLLARRGGATVFFGRWVAFFRAVMPALAGSARMPYPRFLAFNVAGGVVWGVAVVLVGFFAGQSYARVVDVFGRGVAVVAIGLGLLVVVVWQVRRRRGEAAWEPAPPG